MCILFFCQSEICHEDGYRLVLANNRDEVWDRPTTPVHFWGHEDRYISGLDQLPGRSGGTWLGMSRSGRIGVLLNIFGQQQLNKKGRGFMVTDFISGKDDANEFAEKILKEKDDYNGFNLVLFELGREEDGLTAKPLYVSNAQNFSCVGLRNLPANTFFGVSNSPLEFPYQKVIHGKAKFGQIISQYPSVGTKEYLVQSLLGMMSDRTQYLPDPVLERTGTSLGYTTMRMGQLSAINVWSPVEQHGSCVTSIILVDGQGKVDYIEQTVEPTPQGEPEKTIRRKEFNLTRDI